MIKLFDLLIEGKSKLSMKINNEYVIGEVKQIRPQIFAVAIKDKYQRTMLFCRYVEYNKSPYDEIRNKFFTWEKFMEMYRSDFDKDLFTYPGDWEGFGIPSDSIKTAIKTFNKDKGPYDDIMSDIYSYCNKTVNNPKTKWYIIGTDDYSSKIMDHEVAHALYSINDEYKKLCNDLISKIDRNDYQALKKKIKDMGYIDDKETINDEIQASMSTELTNELNIKKFKKYQPEFIENFKKFNNAL
jgi:hypothetical protein